MVKKGLPLFLALILFSTHVSCQSLDIEKGDIYKFKDMPVKVEVLKVGAYKNLANEIEKRIKERDSVDFEDKGKTKATAGIAKNQNLQVKSKKHGNTKSVLVRWYDFDKNYDSKFYYENLRVITINDFRSIFVKVE